MKKLLFISLFILQGIFVFAQKLPSAEVKTLDNKTFNTSEISNNGKPIIISFWATWCKPCIKELTNINEEYQDLRDETGVKLIAVSIDEPRSSKRVAPFVNGRAWDYEVLLDVNSDFKRAMNVVNVPHTFLINGEGKIVWQHTSYVDGDEDELFEKVRELSK